MSLALLLLIDTYELTYGWELTKGFLSQQGLKY